MYDGTSFGMPGADEIGGPSGGFRVTATPAELRVEAWGYWPGDVIAAFCRRAALATHALGPMTAFVFDGNDLKPQCPEAQESFRALFRALAASSFFSARVISKNALTRMQLARLVRECGLFGRVSFDEGKT